MKKEFILYIPEELYWQVVIEAAKYQQEPESWIIGVLEGLIEDEEEDSND